MSLKKFANQIQLTFKKIYEKILKESKFYFKLNFSSLTLRKEASNGERKTFNFPYHKLEAI